MSAFAGGVPPPLPDEMPRTGDDGRFALTGLDTGSYRILGRAQGWLPATELVRFEADRRARDAHSIPIEELLFTLQPAHRLGGRVVRADGVLVADAYLSIDAPAAPGSLSGRTRPDGTFEVDVPEGPLEILVATDRGWHRVAAGSAPEVPEPIVLPAADADLEVRVTLAHGSPPPASVRYDLEAEFMAHRNRELPLEGGLGAIEDLVPGSYRLRVYAGDERDPEQEPQELALVSGERTVAHVRLDFAPRAIPVTVTDREGTPIEGARVHVARSRRRNAPSTDATGRVVVSGIDAPGTRFSVDAPGFAPFLQGEPDLVRQGEVHVELVRESAIDLTLRDASGDLLDRIGVQLSVEGASASYFAGRFSEPDLFGTPRTVLRTREGRLRIDGLAAGRYRLRFLRGELALGERTVEAPPEAVVDLEVTLDRGIAVQGVARWNGAPAAGHVQTSSRGGRSLPVPLEPDGSFTAWLPEAGQAMFELLPEGLSATELPGVVVDVVEGTTVTLDYETVAVRGRVEYADGSAASGLGGSLGDSLRRGGPRYSFRTDRDGRFELPHVVPGRLRWRVSEPGPRHLAPEAFVDVEGSEEIVLRLLGTDEVTFTLVGEPSPGFCSFFHLDEAGNRTRITRYPGYFPPSYTVDWPLGDTRAIVEADGFAPVVLEVRNDPGPTERTVALERAGHVRVTVLGATGDPFAHHRFVVEPEPGTRLDPLFREDETDHVGRRTKALGAGTYGVSARIDGRDVERRVRVAAEQTLDVELRATQ